MDSAKDSAKTDAAKANTSENSVASPQPAPNDSNPVNGGQFLADSLMLCTPKTYEAFKPSLTASRNNGYSNYISAFFQSPDNQVEFYIFFRLLVM